MTALRPAPKPHVLLVDDHPDNLNMYALYLRSQGFDVSEARNGREALSCLEMTRPDVVVMDGMPVLDGWEATRQIRADHQSRTIPVIILTGHVISGEEQRARELGATSYLTKPCLPEDLAYEIRRVLGVARPGNGHRAGSPPRDIASKSRPGKQTTKRRPKSK